MKRLLWTNSLITLREHKGVVEIPKSQRYVNRPVLEKIFTDEVLQTKEKRNQKIAGAVEEYGYTQREIADHLGLHFTSVSRLMKMNQGKEMPRK